MTSQSLLTVSATADLLGISARQVTRLAKNGTLPYAHKSPARTGAYLFHRDDVERIAKERAA